MLHSDIIFMFLSTIVKKEFFFDTRAVVAHRSWGRRETLIYVVEGDDAAAARWAGCPSHDLGVAGAPLRKCLGEPPVLLAPGCTSKYYGAPGPCCKYDYGVAWFARSTLAASARFFVFADDDVWFSGQEKSDSRSLQHECSARDRSRERIDASRALREIIARPKMSRNERK